MSDLNKYQDFTKSLAVYNLDVSLHAVEDTELGDSPYVMEYSMPYMYPVLALGEEAGEVLGKVAKFIRKSNTGISQQMLAKLRGDVGKELGDTLFQLSETARQFGFTLQEIADMNVAKLTDRKERGVLVGEGDSR